MFFFRRLHILEFYGIYGFYLICNLTQNGLNLRKCSRSVPKESNYFEYLEDGSHDPNMTWQPFKVNISCEKTCEKSIYRGSIQSAVKRRVIE